MRKVPSRHIPGSWPFVLAAIAATTVGTLDAGQAPAAKRIKDGLAGAPTTMPAQAPGVTDWLVWGGPNRDFKVRCDRSAGVLAGGWTGCRLEARPGRGLLGASRRRQAVVHDVQHRDE